MSCRVPLSSVCSVLFCSVLFCVSAVLDSRGDQEGGEEEDRGLGHAAGESVLGVVLPGNTHTLTHFNTYAHTHSHAHTHTLTHSHTHTHVHIHTHTYLLIESSQIAI